MRILFNLITIVIMATKTCMICMLDRQCPLHAPLVPEEYAAPTSVFAWVPDLRRRIGRTMQEPFRRVGRFWNRHYNPRIYPSVREPSTEPELAIPLVGWISRRPDNREATTQTAPEERPQPPSTDTPTSSSRNNGSSISPPFQWEADPQAERTTHPAPEERQQPSSSDTRTSSSRNGDSTISPPFQWETAAYQEERRAEIERNVAENEAATADAARVEVEVPEAQAAEVVNPQAAQQD